MVNIISKKMESYNLKIIEPFYTIIRVCLLNFYPDNTKLSISNNQILNRLPTMYQGILRWSYGETRLDLDTIEKSILTGLLIIHKFKYKSNIKNILYYLYCGINKLTLCYIEDSKYKLKLQHLEKYVKQLYTTDVYTDNDNKKTIATSLLSSKRTNLQTEKFWLLCELKYMDTLFLNINQLYKIQSIPLKIKEEIRENFIVIIKKTLNLKNDQFVKKYLKKNHVSNKTN